jgi:NADPH:quinone reductase-like Zn-dependent oxidoreductase
MKGVIFESAGATPKVVDDLPVPEPSPDQILVKSLYAAMNPVYGNPAHSLLTGSFH